MIVLSTPRLVLRRIERSDLDFLLEMRSDPEVMRFFPKTESQEEVEAYLQRTLGRYEQFGHAHWLVADRGTGEPRGTIGVITQPVEGREIIEVGYLIHRPYWRQGLAFEAASACRDWAFEHLDIERVHSLIRPINLPSQAVARKMGMTPAPENVMFHSVEHHLFGITREDWERVRT